jgi:hypothetical protein
MKQRVAELEECSARHAAGHRGIERLGRSRNAGKSKDKDAAPGTSKTAPRRARTS